MLDHRVERSNDFHYCSTAIDHYRPRWYAAYTRSRHEKQVAEQLKQKSIELFLPLYKATHNWNGRRAIVELPLFPGYVFVRMPLVERLRVLEIPSVSSLVGFQGAPIPLPDEELEQMRWGLAQQEAEPYPYLHAGDRVRVKSGLLAGLNGMIVRQNGKTRFVLSIDLIMRSIVVNVDAADLERVEATSVA